LAAVGRCAEKRDAVTVRDGAARDSTVLATYCGAAAAGDDVILTSHPVVVTSGGDTALVEFVSDGDDQRQGFSASFQFMTVDDKDLSLPLGHVTHTTPPLPAHSISRPSGQQPRSSVSAFGMLNVLNE